MWHTQTFEYFFASWSHRWY